VVTVLSPLLLVACSDRPPTLGEGIAPSIGDTPYFDERVKQRFPVGSEEKALLAELRSERFKTRESPDPSSPYRSWALYEQSELFCKNTWEILWSADAGKITNIKATSRAVCL